jgi:DUF438 domain-containing protein
MRPHETLQLDIGPLRLIEYLLKVHALLVRPREQHLHHNDEVHAHGSDLQRHEDFEVDPFVLQTQEDQQIYEHYPDCDVDDEV